VVEDPDEQEEKGEVFNADYYSPTLKTQSMRLNLTVMLRRIMKIKMMVEIIDIRILYITIFTTNA